MIIDNEIHKAVTHIALATVVDLFFFDFYTYVYTSNSMKLWAMPCMATQDGQVMVKSSDKTLEKGMANHFSIIALRTPWTVWKSKKIRWTRKPVMMQSTGLQSDTTEWTHISKTIFHIYYKKSMWNLFIFYIHIIIYNIVLT